MIEVRTMRSPIVQNQRSAIWPVNIFRPIVETACNPQPEGNHTKNRKSVHKTLQIQYAFLSLCAVDSSALSATYCRVRFWLRFPIPYFSQSFSLQIPNQGGCWGKVVREKPLREKQLKKQE